MDTPDIFRRGKIAYDSLIEKLGYLFELLPLNVQEQLFDGDFDNLQCAFSLVLQESIFELASENNVVYYLEMLYIADLGDNDVRLDQLVEDNIKAESRKAKFTYLMLADQSPDDIALFRNEISRFVADYKEKLLTAFAVATVLLKHEMKEIFEDKLCDVYDAFMKIDGRIQVVDPQFAYNAIENTFFADIVKYRTAARRLLK